jgi:hypothetical protein
LRILQRLKKQKILKKRLIGALIGLIVLISAFMLFTTNTVESDELSSEQIQTRLSEFNNKVGLVSINLSDDDELSKAYKSMDLPDAELATLQIFLEKGMVRLVWLTIWDDLAEDGDTVEISSSGYKRVVVLKNETIAIAIPVGSENITITGIKDGMAGGITAGIKTSSGKVLLPVMREGQEIELRV